MPEGTDPNILYALMVGVGLSAATGFRIFVPFLIAGVAGRMGIDGFAIPEGFDWISSWPAIAAFGVATVVEVGGYYVPWIDNALDTIATPMAAAAGTIMAAGFLPDLGPWFEWGVGAIVGGGSATTIQLGTVLTRAMSSGTTGGLGNPGVATAEVGGAATASILAVVLPAVGFILIVLVLIAVIRLLFFRKKKERTIEPPEPPTTTPGPDSPPAA